MKNILIHHTLNVENIKQKIKDMLELGYSYNDIIKMTKQLPAIYGYSIENIKQKIKEFSLILIIYIDLS